MAELKLKDHWEHLHNSSKGDQSQILTRVVTLVSLLLVLCHCYSHLQSINHESNQFRNAHVKCGC